MLRYPDGLVSSPNLSVSWLPVGQHTSSQLSLGSNFQLRQEVQSAKDAGNKGEVERKAEKA